MDFLKSLTSHSDISVHVIGWLFALVGTLATMLHKGLHKRITLQAEDIKEMRSDLDQLIGEHKVRHKD